MDSRAIASDHLRAHRQIPSHPRWWLCDPQPSDCQQLAPISPRPDALSQGGPPPAASVSPGSSLDMQIHGSTLTCQARAGTGPRRPVSRRQVIGVGTGVGELTLVHRELWLPGHGGKCGQLAPRPPPQAPARMPTAGLPSPPHTLQGPCSFLLPDPHLPHRSPGHQPAAVSIPCPWSEEHGPAQGSGPSTPSHLTPALHCPHPHPQQARAWSDSVFHSQSCLQAKPQPREPPRGTVVSTMQSRPPAPSHVWGVVTSKPTMNTQKCIS